MRKSITRVPCLIAAIYFGMNVQAQTTKSDTIIKEQKVEEIVMIGYGTAKKSDLTGSVAVVNGADMAKIPVPNVAEALTGRVAGLQVTTSEGSPDATVNLKVRGGTSLTGDSNPLIIVDGFPVNNLSDVSSSDIENISILKDASSTAIYGSRGANGVILVTTKSGKAGRISVSLNSFLGYKFLAKKYEVLSPFDYAKWQYEYSMLRNANPDSYEKYFGTFADMGQYRNYEGLDWQNEIIGNTGIFSSTDLGVRGGTDKLSYNLGLAHFNDEGIMLGSGYKRDNLSLALKNKVNDKLELGFRFRYSNTTVEGGGANEQKEVSSADSRLRNIIQYAPIAVPDLITEDTDESLDDYLINPYTSLADNNREQSKRYYTVQGTLNWKIIKNLEFRSEIGQEFYRNKDYRFYGRSTYYIRNVPATENQGFPALINTGEDDSRFRNANTLSYDFKKMLGENHVLKLMVGQEFINYKENTLTDIIHHLPTDFSFDDAVNLSGQGKPFLSENYNFADDRLLSFFSRVNYDFKNRYLFTATLRGDGSSKFLGDNKWGYFPSVAAAWKISSESFLEDVSWIKLLKMRLSYGTVGNNNIPTGQQRLTYQSGTTSWFNPFSNFWYASLSMPNPDLKWETTVTQNLGLDFELFSGRVSGVVDYYINKTNDLLVQFPTPGTGYDYQYQNIGNIENKGIEAALNIDAIRKQDFRLSFAINSSWNKNKVTSLGSLDSFLTPSTWTSSTGIGNDFYTATGLPVGNMYGYVNEGRYEVSDFDYNAGVYTLKSGVISSSSITGVEGPGTMKLKDINGDGVINADDRMVIGNANPKNTGGFSLNAIFKNFDLSAAFNWSIGNDVYNADKIEYSTAPISSPNGQYRNLSSVMQDGVRWTNINPTTGALVTDPTELAALNANTTLWSPYMARYVLTDWAIEDGSFLRLNNLTLGYTLPESLVSKLKLSKIRLYATAYNVFLLTNYTGSDPEVSTRRKTNLTPGVDSSPYPRSRQIIFGFNLNF